MDDTIVLPSRWRLGARIFAGFWLLAGGAAVASFAWFGAWALVVIGGLGILVIVLAAMRTSRIRLAIQPDRLVVANQFRTTVIPRADVRTIDVGPSANPFGDYVTVVVGTGSSNVAIEVLAVPAGAEERLDADLDRLERWLRRR